MKWFYVISITLVLVLSAAPFALLEEENTEELKGKIVAYNIYGSKVKSIDPATCGDTTSSGIQGNIFEGLYCYHYLNRPLEVIPQLADGMPQVSPDGLTWTIKIKKGVKYASNPCFSPDSDGVHTREVVAADFVLAFKRIADYHITTKLSLAFIEDKIVGLKDYHRRTRRYEKGDFSRYRKEQIEGIKAPGKHTLRIKLLNPFPQFQYVLAMHVYAPIPHEIIDYYLQRRNGGELVPMADRKPEIHFLQAAVGTGPYVLKKWVRAGKIVLERNPLFREEYYPSRPDDKDLTEAQRENVEANVAAGLYKDAGKRVPFIDVIHLVFVAESNPAWMMFEEKKRDSAGIPRDVYSDVVSPDKRLLAKWQKKGIRLTKDTYPAIYWLAFNLDDPVVGQSKSLRQAIRLCYDVEKGIDLLHNGRGIRAVNIIPSNFAGHKEAGPGPYARVDMKLARAKYEQAKKELVAAGVIKPGDPIPRLTLDLPGKEESQRRMGAYAKRQFSKIGLKLKVELNDWPTLQKKVNSKQCQMYAMGWHADYPDAENFLQLFYSPNIQRGTNNTNYSDPKFDKLFEQASVIVEMEKRIPLYVEMARMISEDCPVLLLREPVTYLLSYDWVYNLKLHPIGYGFRKYQRIDPTLRRMRGGK